MPDDYRLVFVISLAAAVIGVALLALLVPDLRPRREAHATAPPVRPTVRLLAEPGFARLVAAAGLLGLLTLSDAFIYLVLQDRNDLAALWFPLLFVGTNLAYLALAVPFGRVADRLGRGRVMVLGHVFLVGAYLCASGPVGRSSSRACCLLLLGSFYAATDGVLAAAAASAVRPEVRGSAIATAQSAVAIARLAAAVVFGWSWTLVGPGRAALFMAGLLAVAGAAGLAAAADARGAPPMSQRARIVAFAVVVVLAVTAVVVYAALPGGTYYPTRRPCRLPQLPRWRRSPTSSSDRRRWARLRQGGDVHPDRPGGPRAVTANACERVDQRAGTTLCLRSKPGVVLGSSVTAWDRSGREVYSRDLPGIPSRARLSPDGTLAATTAFVTGDSYLSAGFATRTYVHDLAKGTAVHLEDFALTHEGRRVSRSTATTGGSPSSTTTPST